MNRGLLISPREIMTDFELALVQSPALEFPGAQIHGCYFHRPRMWNYYNHSGLEGWHNRMKRITRKAHPNLYEVLELFQREQAAGEVTMQQLQSGGVRRKKRRKVEQREEKVKELQGELSNGDRDIDSYLSAIKHCVVAFDLAKPIYFVLTYNIHHCMHTLIDTI